MKMNAGAMETTMLTFPAPVSCIAIAARVAEWRRRTRSRHELTMFDDQQFGDLPFGRAEARAEFAKWFWQP
jgi:uncharacterized protein YjiS (DUF1127 family)